MDYVCAENRSSLTQRTQSDANVTRVHAVSDAWKRDR
jgi:hypothetical protein